MPSPPPSVVLSNGATSHAQRPSSMSTISTTNATGSSTDSTPSSGSSSEPGSSARLTTANIINSSNGRRSLRKRDPNTNYSEPGGSIPYREISESSESGSSTGNSHVKKSTPKQASPSPSNPALSVSMVTLAQTLGAYDEGSARNRSLNIDPTPVLSTLLPSIETKTATFPETINLSGAQIINGLKLVLADGTVKIQKGDDISLVCEPPCEPYYIGKVMGFQLKDTMAKEVNPDSLNLTKEERKVQSQLVQPRTHSYQSESGDLIEDANNFQIRMNWYYRPRDISVQSSDSRRLYASLNADLCPLDSYRGHVTVEHKSRIANLGEYKRQEGTYWFDKMYDRYLAKFYDVVPTDKIIGNLPQSYLKALNKRYAFVFYESGKAGELFDVVERSNCLECSQWCPVQESIRCDKCRSVRHGLCLDEKSGSKNLRGISWVCPDCVDNKGTAKIDKFETLNLVGKRFLQKDQSLSFRQRRDQEEWTYRYIGLHTTLDNCLQLNSSVYPRMASRIAAKHQYTGMQPWFDHHVEYYDLEALRPDIREKVKKDKADTLAALIKRRKKPMKKLIPDDGFYLQQKSNKPLPIPQHYYNQQLSQLPPWLQERPHGYIERGGDDTVEQLWGPTTKLTPSEIDQYVDDQKDIADKLQIKVYSPNFMDAVLANLYRSSFNREISRNLNLRITRQSLKEPTFTPMEVRKFEESVKIHGNQLHDVSKDLATQPPGMVVRYYYMWKKTPSGRAIWGSYPGRKRKKEYNLSQANANVINISPTKGKPNSNPLELDEEASLTTSDQIINTSSSTLHCRYCLTETSSKWFIVPEELHTSNSASCIRCARLWRRYAVQWVNAARVFKDLGALPSSINGSNFGAKVDLENVLHSVSSAQWRGKSIEWELVRDAVGVAMLKSGLGDGVSTAGSAISEDFRLKRRNDWDDSVSKRQKVEIIDEDEMDVESSDFEESESESGNQVVQGATDVEIRSFAGIESTQSDPQAKDILLDSPERSQLQGVIHQIKSENSALMPSPSEVQQIVEDLPVLTIVESDIKDPLSASAVSSSAIVSQTQALSPRLPLSAVQLSTSSLIQPPMSITRHPLTHTLLQPLDTPLNLNNFKQAKRQSPIMSTRSEKNVLEKDIASYELFNAKSYHSINYDNGHGVCFVNKVSDDFVPLCLKEERKTAEVTPEVKDTVSVVADVPRDAAVADAPSDAAIVDVPSVVGVSAEPITKEKPVGVVAVAETVVSSSGVQKPLFAPSSEESSTPDTDHHSLADTDVRKEQAVEPPSEPSSELPSEPTGSDIIKISTRIQAEEAPVKVQEAHHQEIQEQATSVRYKYTAEEKKNLLAKTDCQLCLQNLSICRPYQRDGRHQSMNKNCKHCALKFHEECYFLELSDYDGENLIPEKWRCDTCQNELNPVVSRDYRCYICDRASDESLMLLKPNVHGDWYHYQCLFGVTLEIWKKYDRKVTYQELKGKMWLTENGKRQEIKFEIPSIDTTILLKNQYSESLRGDWTLDSLVLWPYPSVKKPVNINDLVSAIHPMRNTESTPIAEYLDLHKKAFPSFWSIITEQPSQTAEVSNCYQCCKDLGPTNLGNEDVRAKFLCPDCLAELTTIRTDKSHASSFLDPSQIPDDIPIKPHHSYRPIKEQSIEKLMLEIDKINKSAQAGVHEERLYSQKAFERRLQILKWTMK
ncbi:hypothetical protein WICPIJ_000340 [Wickerhamomyces pijperi]|uniref:BAH domain-containing protein n=1 Tax=Wickerhamomyces pijperi TaxID=599730 RepID=A0A9P8QGY6_WICPI|nr:hypothetical protein WICPIJ_000340 [Wickerhamomyces pijperi]